MQALSAFGNMLASGLSLKITPGVEGFWGHYSGWQVLSFVSVFPAILAVPMVLILKEPQAWIKAKAEAATGGAGKAVGSIANLFRQPRWRRFSSRKSALPRGPIRMRYWRVWADRVQSSRVKGSRLR